MYFLPSDLSLFFVISPSSPHVQKHLFLIIFNARLQLTFTVVRYVYCYKIYINILLCSTGHVHSFTADSHKLHIIYSSSIILAIRCNCVVVYRWYKSLSSLVETPVLSIVVSFNCGVRQNVASHAFYTARSSTFLTSAFLVQLFSVFFFFFL